MGILSSLHKLSDRVGNNPTVKDTREIVEIMKGAVLPLLTNDARKASWFKWENNELRVARICDELKKAYYGLGTLALLSAITVPSLVGLNLSGTGGSVVRWLTFGFSLVAAISTGMLALYRINDRWLTYRRFKDELMEVGWSLVDESTYDPDKSWEAFTAATDKVISSFNRAYEVTVIQAARSVSDYREMRQGEQPRPGSLGRMS